MLAIATTVAELSAIRQSILDDSETPDSENFEMLMAVEDQIEKASFKTAEDKRLGNLILMEDHPSRWDNFQESLFLQMQKFA